jgi:hypothetical protein
MGSKFGVVSKVHPDLGFIGNFLLGNAQTNGSDERVIERLGGDIRIIYNKVKVTTTVKVNDWGPFDPS